MTVQVQTPRNTFVGDGANTTFAFTFRILENEHLVVELDGVTQTEITHYTLDSLTSLGGNVEMLTAPVNLADLLVYRAVPKTQLVDYNPYDAFPAETHELALDKLTMMSQDNTDLIVNIGGPVRNEGDVLTIDAGDNYTWVQQIGKPEILDQVLSSVAGVLSIDFTLGQSVYVAMTENITSTVVTGLPTGALAQIELEIDQDTVARTWVWPAPITWIGGTEPDLTVVSGKYLVRIRTRDSGTSWMGTFGEDFS